MSKPIEVRWEHEFPAPPEQVWEAITRHSDGWLWKIEYEPRLGGAERGLTAAGGTVTAWDPPRHFTTRAHDLDGFNQLDYRLEPSAGGTHVQFTHNGVLPDEDYEAQLDCCRQHTAFYRHSLGEYVTHFSGRAATYVSVDAPEASTKGGMARVRQALGLADDVAAGDRVRLEPAALAPIEGSIDYATHAFLGIRNSNALYRFYGRDAWGWPVGVAHHLFADGVDKTAEEHAWNAWLTSIFATEEVA
jgi:uncharacterized protein YndB with AHSA1/START domain